MNEWRIVMYAVFKTGGKQYRVQSGDVLKVELLTNDIGSEIVFSDVMMVNDGNQLLCGTPIVSGASVKAEVVSHGRHKKVNIIKFRRRKHHMKRMGHRQYFTEIKIADIQVA